MKKSIYITLVALFVGWGCDKEPTSDTPQTELTVSFSTLATSRGTLITSTDGLQDFGVYASTATSDYPTFMYNIQVTRQLSQWVYSPSQSWGSGGYYQIEFWAYAPYASSTNGITPSSESTTIPPYIEFEMPQDVTMQEDLMIAQTSINQTLGCVELSFSHALAAVEFIVSGCDEQSIDSLVVSNIVSYGVVEMTLSNDSVTWSIDSDRTRDYTIKPDQDGYTLLSIPQTLSSNSTISLYLNQEQMDYPFPDNTSWQASQIYTYEIALDSGVVNLSGVENCYVVPPVTDISYRFDAITRVNQFWGDSSSGGVDPYQPHITGDGAGYLELGSNDNTIGPDDRWYMELIWADFEESQPITLLQSSDNCGIGNQMAEFSLNTSTHGNILIGIKKEGNDKYLWSWHLWLTDYDPNSSTEPIYLPADEASGFYNNSREMMCRNLGATTNDCTSDKAYGLYYQWGRKDPFYYYGCHWGDDNEQSSDYSNCVWTSSSGSLLNVVSCPSTFFYNAIYPNDPYSESFSTHAGDDFNRWGGSVSSTSTEAYENTKTIYDPCPEGWRVPSGENWSGLSDSCFSSESLDTWHYNDYFSLCGYRFFLLSNYLFSVGSNGKYWSGSPAETYLYSTYGYALSFESDFSNLDVNSTCVRTYGCSIRPIRIK